MRLHCLEGGAGPTVVLLHGFPDLARGWRRQSDALVQAGCRVLAPDLRGYGGSDRPRGVGAYSLTRLAADVEALLEAEPEPCAALVGHDWGGIIAWTLAARRPDLMHRLVILNAPHPALFRRALRSYPRQLLRSWYVGFAQLPLLPEAALRARDCAVIRGVLGRAESGDRMLSGQELRVHVEAFREPGALTAALNYYRAAARDLLTRRLPAIGRVDVPTLVIWGEQDKALDSRLLLGLGRRVPRLAIERLPHVGHFLHWQDPQTVNALLLAFVK